MKKIIAILIVVCFSLIPVTVFAEPIERSDLEEMSVKELKELRDMINDILGDGGGSSSSTSEYGNLTGTLTYYYNDYKGHVADAESTVLLIPIDADELDINTSNLIRMEYAESQDFGDDVYFVKVNGMGTYTINHIPQGDYQILFVSGQTKGQGWFDATENGNTDPKFYQGIASRFEGRITEDDALAIAEAIAFSQYSFQKVTIYAGETITLDYDFGMTYI